MSYDFRKGSNDALSFYVYNNLRAVQDKMKSSIYRYNTLQEAMDKFNELPKTYTTAIGGSIYGTQEIDFIHRIQGEPVLVTDFKQLNFWKDDPAVQKAIDESIAYLNVKYEGNHDLLDGHSILVELERYQDPKHMDPYYDDKQLYPFVSQHLISAIDEAFVEGHGWLPIRDILKMADNYGYNNPECPKIGRVNVNYITKDGRRGQADMSTHDFGVLKAKTERYLEQQNEHIPLDKQINNAETEKNVGVKIDKASPTKAQER